MVHYTQAKLKAEGFQYTKGNLNNLKRALAWVDPDNSQSFDNWGICVFCIDKKYYVEGCVCGHDIRYEYRIRHIRTDDTMEIGSHCIDLFSDEIKLRRRQLKKQLDSPDSTFCIKCERKIPQKTIDKYPDEKIKFHDKCYKLHKQELYDNEAIECKWCEFKPLRKDFETHTETHKDKIELHKAKNTTMKWGKHKNMSLYYVLRFDKSYLRWLAENAYDDDLKDKSKLLLI